LKKLFIVILIVVAIVSIAKAEDTKWNFTLSVIHDSRYIFDGIDFGAKNDASADTFGISTNKGNFNAYGYAVTSDSYFEWGGTLDYSFIFGPVSFKSVFYPFGWHAQKTYWGAVFIEEMNVKSSVATFTAKWSGAYLPDKEFEGRSGHYFYFGLSKEVFGLKIQGGANYNLHYVTLGRGWGGIFGVTKSIELNDKVALDVYFRYYINHPLVNEDEKVIGATLSIKL